MYMWLKPSQDLATDLLDRVLKQRTFLQSSGIFDSAAKAMRYYYGNFYDGQWGHGLGQTGEQGELVTTSMNHFRSLVRHSLDLVTQENLVFDATSENSDPAVRDQAIVAESVLNHYYYTKNFGSDVFEALELATLCGTSYLETYWEDQDRLYGADGEEMVFVGSPKFRARSFLDVTVDKLFETKWDRQNWVVVRDTENRWDLIKRFPKLKSEIERAEGVRDDTLMAAYGACDELWVYRAYHRECAALPAGRMLLFLHDGTVLREFKRNGKFYNPYSDEESPNSPNGALTLHCLRPQLRHGCHHGYTKAWDLIPMQETHNLLASTVATNQSNFGLQHIAVPRDANINRALLAGGTAVYEYDVLEGGAGVPTPLSLCATPPEVFKFMEDQVLQMETIYGVNAIMRGKIDTSIPPTGVASAIFAAQGQIMNNDLEKCYYAAVKSATVFLLYMIARFQKFEDTILVMGRDKSGMLKKFSGQSVKAIRDVRISVGNPMAKTFAGKTALMEVLLQYGLIKTPEQAMEVLETGNVKSVMEWVTAENKYIRDENDMMIRGEKPLMLGTDNHVRHILAHKIVMDNPTVRNNAKLLAVVTAHVEEHLDQIDIQSEQNPMLFTMILTEGGKVPMPIPVPESGMVPQQGGAGLPEASASPEAQQAMAATSEMPSGAMSAQDATQGAAMQAMNAASNQVAKAAGELPS